MSHKAVIFDLDGTLLDTVGDIADAMNRVLAKRGWPTRTLSDYRLFVGHGSEMQVRCALPPDVQDWDTIQLCEAEYEANYNDLRDQKTRIFVGIPALLDSLMSRQVPMAIVSNKPHESVMHSVTSFLPNWKFDVVIGASDKLPLKPDPAGALEVSRRMGILPEEFVYLGDTAIDMKAAFRAGMFGVGALWGFRPDELERAGAQALIQRPIDLVSLL